MKVKETPQQHALSCLSLPAFTQEHTPCRFCSCHLSEMSLFVFHSLCNSISSETYPLFGSTELPHFHPLLYCHHKPVFSGIYFLPPQFALTGHADLLKYQQLFSHGSGELFHSSQGSPYSGGCILNFKPMWSIPRSKPQLLIWVTVGFYTHSDLHRLSGLDSECIFSEGYSRSEEKRFCFPLETTLSKSFSL